MVDLSYLEKYQESILIKNTTPEERKNKIKSIIALNALGDCITGDYAKSMYQKYIDGEMEFLEVTNEILKAIEENSDEL